MAHKLLGVLAFNLIILQHILDHLMEKKYFAKSFQLLKKLGLLRKKYFPLEQNIRKLDLLKKAIDKLNALLKT